MSRWSQQTIVTVALAAILVLGVAVRPSSAANYSAAAAQMRRAYQQQYQQQMKEQAAIQKQIDLAEQKAAAAQAADDKRKAELIAKARRNQREKEAFHRQAITARLKAENAAKEAASSKTDAGSAKDTKATETK